jgi:UDP-glucuronate 4-epimerase
MRALVTGVAGFIGSNLAARLLREGHEVLGADCFVPYYPRQDKEVNLAPLRQAEGFRFVEADLRGADLEPLVEVDVVFHLAAQPGVRSSWGRPFADYAGHNLVATQRLLEACRAGGAPRLVMASSSSVYGDAERHPTPEDVLPRPVSPYGVTKLAAEHLLDAYASNFGLSTVALRYFTVYGPGQRPDMAFHRFIRAALEGRPITVFGDGEQSRDVTFVDDAVEATVAAGQTDEAAGAVNVGGGSEVSVNEVLQLVEDLCGRPLDVRREDPVPGDVRRTSADLERARALLGFRPRVGIEEGLRRQVDSVRARLAASAGR